jgi:hypothetical protein
MAGFTLEQLKSRAYDLLGILEKVGNELKAVNNAIATFKEEPKEEPKKEEEKK